jgi:hypothetical protein
LKRKVIMYEVPTARKGKGDPVKQVIREAVESPQRAVVRLSQPYMDVV